MAKLVLDGDDLLQIVVRIAYRAVVCIGDLRHDVQIVVGIGRVARRHKPPAAVVRVVEDGSVRLADGRRVAEGVDSIGDGLPAAVCPFRQIAIGVVGKGLP